jgi:AcrR family transcriptional regulator
MAEDRHGTRARIQAVALDMFGEQGYEKTSLREIAERLGVTKAALYYHFRSKEDIVRSLFEDYTADVDGLIAWARSQPRTTEARRELVERYIGVVVKHTGVFQLLERNQAAIQNLESGATKQFFRERIRALIELTMKPDPSLAERVRASMAFTAIHVGWLFFQDEPVSKDELRTIVREVACEIALAPREAMSAS